MTEKWFRPQRYGYGVVPQNGKGWALIAMFFVLIMAASLVPVVTDMVTGAGLTATGAVLWVVGLLIVVFGFVRIAQKNTDGEWRWRWGKD